MDWMAIISRYYAAGYYINDQIKVFMVKGKITASQYEEITGKTYTA